MYLNFPRTRGLNDSASCKSNK